MASLVKPYQLAATCFVPFHLYLVPAPRFFTLLRRGEILILRMPAHGFQTSASASKHSLAENFALFRHGGRQRCTRCVAGAARRGKPSRSRVVTLLICPSAFRISHNICVIKVLRLYYRRKTGSLSSCGRRNNGCPSSFIRFISGNAVASGFALRFTVDLAKAPVLQGGGFIPR